MPTPALSVLIVDDHEIVRRGLAMTLDSDPVAEELRAVGMAGDGREALAMIKENAPDVVITDMRMPRMDGLELIAEIEKLNLDIPVLLLTVVEDPLLIREALDVGASGYLLKTASAREIIDAVRRAVDGELVVSGKVGSIIASQLVESREEQLSAREAEVIALVAQGKTNAKIARDLHLSETTVRTHLRRVFAKLGVQDRTSAVTAALRNGAITLPS